MQGGATEQLAALRQQLAELKVLRAYPTALAALSGFLRGEKCMDALRIHGVSDQVVRGALLNMEESTSYTELLSEHAPPLVVAAIALARDDAMKCVEQCVVLMRTGQLSVSDGNAVVALLGRERAKLVELRLTLEALRQRDEGLSLRRFGDTEGIEQPMSRQAVEYRRLEERLRFEHISTLAAYIPYQNPRVVYYEKQLNVQRLAESVAGKENLLMVYRTTNTSMFFGTYCSDAVQINSFSKGDASFFVFVSNKKDLYVFHPKNKAGSMLRLSDPKGRSVVEVAGAFKLFFQVTNVFMNTRILKCVFDNKFRTQYEEVQGRPVPIKTGSGIGYEILSITVLQWN